MKFAVILFLCVTTSAFGGIETALPALSPAVQPISEVSTNVALSVDFSRLDKVSFTLSLTAAPTNNFALAVGSDANGDGRLSLEEADVTFGYDCGVWYRADTATGIVEETPAQQEGSVENTWTFGKRVVDVNWDTLKIVRRGFSEMNEMAVQYVENQKFVITVR